MSEGSIEWEPTSPLPPVTIAAPNPDAELLEAVLRAYDEAAIPEADNDGPAGSVSATERELWQILRSRARLVNELASLEQNAEIVLNRARSQLKAHDWRFHDRAIALTRSLLKGSGKSVRTFYGTAGFRTVPAGLDVGDLATALVKGPARLVPAHVELDRKKALEMFRQTGEIPPGYELRPEREEFYVK